MAQKIVPIDGQTKVFLIRGRGNNIQTENILEYPASLSLEQVESKVQELMHCAWSARSRAHCPYSKFRVGAAVLTEDGSIFEGVNVENASYGLTVCAERVAIANAVSHGHKKFVAMAVCCDIQDSFKAPCGACRQCLAEFSMDWKLYSVKPDKTWKKMDFAGLLPDAFTPASLDMTRDG